MAAVCNPEIAELARHCIVDFDEDRRDAADMLARCKALVAAAAGGAAGRRLELRVQQVSTGESVLLAVTAQMSIEDVKKIAQRETGVEAAKQRLVFAGRCMDDDRVVDDYNLLDGTVVHMLVTRGASEGRAMAAAAAAEPMVRAAAASSADAAAEQHPVTFEEFSACRACGKSFGVFTRRHHCRECGRSYCDTHSGTKVALPRRGHTEPQRVCDDCTGGAGDH